MKKNGLYLLTLILCAALLVTTFLSPVLAAGYWNPISGTSDWVAMDGNEVDDTAVPADVSLDDHGLTVTYTGGEYIPGGPNAGVMYTKPVDLNNFSIEFTVTQRADYYNTLGTGCDSWISLCLLTSPEKYFNTNRAGESQGIVTLIRPADGMTRFELWALSNSFANNGMFCHEHNGDMKTSFKIEIKKGEDGLYDYYVNGVLADYELYGGRDFSKAFVRLMESKEVYLYMGVSSKDSSQQIQWTITKINGEPVNGQSTTPPTAEPTDPTEEPTEPSTNPTAEPTEPTDDPTEPTAEPTDPTGDPTEPSEEPKPTETQPVGGEEPAEEEGGFPWIIAIIAVAAVAVIAVAVVIVKKKK